MELLCVWYHIYSCFGVLCVFLEKDHQILWNSLDQWFSTFLLLRNPKYVVIIYGNPILYPYIDNAYK